MCYQTIASPVSSTDWPKLESSPNYPCQIRPLRCRKDQPVTDGTATHEPSTLHGPTASSGPSRSFKLQMSMSRRALGEGDRTLKDRDQNRRNSRARTMTASVD